MTRGLMFFLVSAVCGLGCREAANPPVVPRLPDAAPVAPDTSPSVTSPSDAAPVVVDATDDARIDGAFEITMGSPKVSGEAAESEKPAVRAAAKRRARKKRKKIRSASSPPPSAVSRRGVARTIEAHMGDVEHCYGRVALADPSIAGRIVMQWTLGRDGTPQAVAVRSDSLRDKSVAACIKARSKHWKFPPPEGGMAVVSYPFHLRVQ